MGGSYDEKFNINETDDSRTNKTANKIYLILVLILIILSVTMLGIYMSTFKLLASERYDRHSDGNHDHHHEISKEAVKLNKTFNDKNGGHTFVVKSLAALGNDLLASSGYDSQIKIWYFIIFHLSFWYFSKLNLL